MKISVEDRLPNDGQYVLAFFPDKPWIDGDAKNSEHKWVVVKFKRGISEDDRKRLGKENPLKNTYRAEDEHGNNILPYYWQSFGASSFFGHECSFWCELPK